MECKEGIVTAVLPDSIEVSLVRSSACSGCHAKGACTSADTKPMALNITRYPSNVQEGDRVRVIFSERMGLQAVVVAFVLPLLVILLLALLLTYLGYGETKVLLSVLGVLLLYYVGLTLFRDHLKRSFSLRAELSDAAN